MNMRSFVLTTVACALLAPAGLLMAQASNAPAKPAAAKAVAPKAAVSKTIVTHGTISSIDANQLVLSEKGKDGKTSTKTFMLDKGTAKTGSLQTGSEVTVHYKSDNDHLMATSLVGKAEKAVAKPAAKAPAKK